ncbi:MAG: hypothetical protein AAGA18_13265 [Verrucomicrobiota bacterium]
MNEVSPALVYTITIMSAIGFTASIVFGVKFMRDRVKRLSKKFDEDPEPQAAEPQPSFLERAQSMIPKVEDFTKAKASVKDTFVPKIKLSDNPFEQLRESCALLQNTEEPPTPAQIQNMEKLFSLIEQQHPQSKDDLTRFRAQLNRVSTDPSQLFLFLIELHKWTDQHKGLCSS